jgi:hypothetical protein
MFIAALLSADPRTRADKQLGPVVREVAVQLPELESCASDRTAYYALCERAWLRWCRLALDEATHRGLRQVSTRPFMPGRIRSAEDAHVACVRLDRHVQLLDLLASRGDGSDWESCVESARHVHGATRRALRFAVRLARQHPPDLFALSRGVASAADALQAAIMAGFIAEPREEIQATVEAMAARAAARG